MCREDIQLPLRYPIGLAVRWKPLGKVSLIIVKGLVTMPKASGRVDGGRDSVRATANLSGHNAAGVRPTEAQRRYLERGLTQAGGKLPHFDRDGREVPKRTVESCLVHGWAERWAQNPIKPDWLVCRLTDAGYRALGVEPPMTGTATAGPPPPPGLSGG
jgi:hypothetical protein